MRDADLTRCRDGSSAQQSNVADGVVRRTEWSRRHERISLGQPTGDAMNFRRFDCFLDRHRRNDCGDAFREHRLPGAGRTDHENIVSAGDGDLERAFDVGLPFDIAEIDLVILVGGEEFFHVAAHRLEDEFTPEKRIGLAQISDTVDGNAVDHCGLARVCRGNEKSLLSASPRL